MTMFGAFRGKLFSAGYWCNVAASWSSYLMRLEKDGSPQFEVDADGNVEAAGLVAAPQLDLGTSSTIDAASFNSAVLGGDHNELGNAPGCTISGDKNSIVWAEYSAIVGGIESVIGNGADVSEVSTQCFVAGGEAGSGVGHSSRNCSVTGGYTTTIGNGCAYDVIGGGLNNVIADGVASSVIGGGQGNTISAAGGAVIPGGINNTVSGTYGIAAGIGATAAHDGAAVWCDSTGATTPLASSAANEWTARATGGFRLYNAADGSKYATLAAGELTVSDKVITPALKVTGGTPGAGKVLTSDDDGDATWAAAATTSPGGNDGQIQYNNSGAFGGTTGLTWNSTTGTLGVGVSATGGVVNIASDVTQTPITITKAHDADNTVATAVLVKQNIGGAGGAATGFGSQIAWQLDTTTTDNQDAAYMSASWYDGIHATRRGQLTFGVTSYAGTETGLRIIAGDGTPNIVCGYSGNSVTGGKVGCVIGGGGGASNTNAAAENYVTIGGGYNNKASGKYCTIAGGRANTAGATNVLYSTVGGGYDNYINGASGVIIGGGNNTIASYSDFCTILGGGNNVFAEGMDHGCIAGWRTKACHAGVFLWSDGTDVDFSSFAANELAVRASGGVRFVTNAEASTVVKTFAPADVNTGNEQITITGHTFNNGDRVRFTSTATLPGGLAINTDYWVTVVSPDIITVSKSGYTATAVNLTSGGTAGATHTATKYVTTQTAISAAGVFQPGGGYNSVDGTAGMSDSRSWTDADANDHTVTIKNGLITAWTVTPPA